MVLDKCHGGKREKREEDGEFVNRWEKKQRSCKALVLLQSLFHGPTMQIQGEDMLQLF